MGLSVFTPEYFMREALKQAQKALDTGEIPVGAVVVCDDRIIARAHNQVELLNDPTAHAEILAITAACENMGTKYLEGCSLYVTLEPCVMCAGATYWSQLVKIEYAASDPKRGFSRFGRELIHPKCEVSKGLLKEESEFLLNNFFNRLRG